MWDKESERCKLYTAPLQSYTGMQRCQRYSCYSFLFFGPKYIGGGCLLKNSRTGSGCSIAFWTTALWSALLTPRLCSSWFVASVWLVHSYRKWNKSYTSVIQSGHSGSLPGKLSSRGVLYPVKKIVNYYLISSICCDFVWFQLRIIKVFWKGWWIANVKAILFYCATFFVCYYTC